MQIHYALKAPPQWRDPELSKVALLHLTPGLDGVSKSEVSRICAELDVEVEAVGAEGDPPQVPGPGQSLPAVDEAEMEVLGSWGDVTVGNRSR